MGGRGPAVDWERRIPLLLGDCVAWAIGLFLALVLRFDGLETSWDQFFPGGFAAAVVVVSAATITLSVLAVLTRGRLAYGSFEEVLRLTVTDLLAAMVLVAVNLLAADRLIPNSVILGGTAIALVASCAMRYTVRLLRERRSAPRATAERTLVFGAGEGGEQTIRAMLRDPSSPYRPVAILDDDPRKAGFSIRGVRVVGGRDDIATAAKHFGATGIVVAIPHAGAELVREVAARSAEAGLRVRVLPPVGELFGTPIGVADIRPVTEVDLLGRAAIETDIDAVAGYIQCRRVLVTGAGGSIGSELCRQIVRLGPSSLCMLDRDESALHMLQLELEGRAMLDSRNLVVADIRDRERMLDVFGEHQPEVVFHAAALKHLPLLEMHPAEAVKTNVFGTLNVLDAAAAVRAARVVNISTDKAADPVSVLGYSKRIAEGLTAWASTQGEGTCISVRFGNVLGSRGSVLTAFHAQIERGGPVTVTHPEVTRFFMTLAEAVQLVIQAGAVGGEGEALVLDMGSPVRIADVAEQLVAQSGSDIEVVYTGLRPGEKLHEVLFATGEHDRRPAHPLISHVQVPQLDPTAVSELEGLGDDCSREVLDRLARGSMSVAELHPEKR